MIKRESNAEYHASPALNKSRLFNFERSPEWFKYCEEHPEEKRSDAFIIGSAFHKLVLEPSGFGSEFAVAPVVDRRTKARFLNHFIISARYLVVYITLGGNLVNNISTVGAYISL